MFKIHVSLIVFDHCNLLLLCCTDCKFSFNKKKIRLMTLVRRKRMLLYFKLGILMKSINTHICNSKKKIV